MVTHKFKVKDQVTVTEPCGRQRPAVVVKLRPYQGRPGYDVRYMDAVEQWHSWGGWVPEGNLAAR